MICLPLNNVIRQRTNKKVGSLPFIFLSYLLMGFVMMISSCSKINMNLPEIQVLVMPIVGDTSTIFEFHIQGLDYFQFSRSPFVFKWDFNNDSIVDYQNELSENVLYKFDTIGNYCCLAFLEDQSGKKSSAQCNFRIIGNNQDSDNIVDPRDGANYKIVN